MLGASFHCTMGPLPCCVQQMHLHPLLFMPRHKEKVRARAHKYAALNPNNPSMGGANGSSGSDHQQRLNNGKHGVCIAQHCMQNSAHTDTPPPEFTRHDPSTGGGGGSPRPPQEVKYRRRVVLPRQRDHPRREIDFRGPDDTFKRRDIRVLTIDWSACRRCLTLCVAASHCAPRCCGCSLKRLKPSYHAR